MFPPEKRAYLPSGNALHKQLNWIRVASTFFAVATMCLSAVSIGQLACQLTQSSLDDTLLFGASTLAFLYVLLCLGLAPAQTGISLDDDELGTIKSRRKRRLTFHAGACALCAAVIFAAWVYGAYQVARLRGSCATWYSPEYQGERDWNHVACRTMKAATGFAAANSLLYAAMSYIHIQQARRIY